ncbi:hypothetical protein NM688_g989 [Phlebia brevispora]|uniref:Uncharacterized protein n=1 Tax=Phlebia brevispora TaxID=194682 RepID=A0ACC1TCH0_9APHY|nr:hypothetical protein NM688_g989 [Phlebia brevispora]
MFTTLKHMHLGIVALALLATSSSAQELASLNCFTSGLAADCSSFMDTFCAAAVNVPVAGLNTVSQCFESPEGFRCDFNAYYGEAKNSTPAATFSTDHCEFVLQIASVACPMGGSGRVIALDFGGQLVLALCHILRNDSANQEASSFPHAQIGYTLCLELEMCKTLRARWGQTLGENSVPSHNSSEITLMRSMHQTNLRCASESSAAAFTAAITQDDRTSSQLVWFFATTWASV